MRENGHTYRWLVVVRPKILLADDACNPTGKGLAILIVLIGLSWVGVYDCEEQGIVGGRWRGWTFRHNVRVIERGQHSQRVRDTGDSGGLVILVQQHYRARMANMPGGAAFGRSKATAALADKPCSKRT